MKGSPGLAIGWNKIFKLLNRDKQPCKPTKSIIETRLCGGNEKNR